MVLGFDGTNLFDVTAMFFISLAWNKSFFDMSTLRSKIAAKFGQAELLKLSTIWKELAKG